MSIQQETLAIQRRIVPAEEHILFGVSKLVADVCETMGVPVEVNPIKDVAITVHTAATEKDIISVRDIEGRLGVIAVKDRRIDENNSIKDVTIQVVSPALVEEVHQFGTVELGGVARFTIATVGADAPRYLQDALNTRRVSLGLHDKEITLTPSR